MTQLTDLISTYGPERLAKDLQANKDFRIFNLLWNEPSQIIPLVNSMGWQTVEDVVKWVNSINGAFGQEYRIRRFCELIEPELSFKTDNLPKSNFADIQQAVRNGCPIHPECDFLAQDKDYVLLTQQQIAETAQKFRLQPRKYRAEVLDCDDFTRLYRGWLSEVGLGNAAIGEVHTWYYQPGETSASTAHSMAIAVDASRKVWFVEPQNGSMFDPRGTNARFIGGNLTAAKYDVGRVVF